MLLVMMAELTIVKEMNMYTILASKQHASSLSILIWCQKGGLHDLRTQCVDQTCKGHWPLSATCFKNAIWPLPRPGSHRCVKVESF